MATLEGRRVLVTGAAGAIGAALSAALREQGALVIGLDRTPAEDEGVLECDVRDPEQVRVAVAEALERLGGLDVLVNNAGIGDAHDAGAEPDERALAILDVNYLGAWRVAAAAMPALLESRGRVVNVASGLAVANVPLAGAYMASKRALAAWSDALRLEYGDRLAAVSTVYPGYMRTPIHDAPAERGVSLEGLLPAEPVASTVRAIVRCCDGRARRDVASTIQVAAALRVARLSPALADRLVAARVRGAIRRGRFDGAVIADSLRRSVRGDS
ncbi:MAG: SDR family NAD(P)-dependent oxidoreductase [Thermoleophilaceae bacterium]